MPSQTRETLVHSHTPAAIAGRLAQATEHSYLRDFVFGAIDGTVTTFAIVAGVAGAELGTGAAIVLGLANMLADGFSMGAGNYLSTKSERERIERARWTEEQHIERIPGGEREEIRQIFAAKGFEGDILDRVVNVITGDRKRWVDTMLTEELGMPLSTPDPRRAALATFAAFVAAGAVPLAPLWLSHALGPTWTYTLSTAGAAAVFVVIGLAKGWVVGRSAWKSSLETLAIGGLAAGVSYGVGDLLRSVVAAIE